MQEQRVDEFEGEVVQAETVGRRCPSFLPAQDPAPERDEPVEPIGQDEVVPVDCYRPEAVQDSET